MKEPTANCFVVGRCGRYQKLADIRNSIPVECVISLALAQHMLVRESLRGCDDA